MVLRKTRTTLIVDDQTGTYLECLVHKLGSSLIFFVMSCLLIGSPSSACLFNFLRSMTEAYSWVISSTFQVIPK